MQPATIEIDFVSAKEPPRRKGLDPRENPYGAISPSQLVSGSKPLFVLYKDI
jgi:hypothetical protein